MSEKSPKLSPRGRAAGARPTFRPTVEALEDRLLLSFSWGEVGSPDLLQTRSQQAAPVILLHGVDVGGSSDVVQNLSDPAAPLIRLRRVVGDTVAAQGVQPEQVEILSGTVVPGTYNTRGTSNIVGPDAAAKTTGQNNLHQF
jgi:hypothetical protein